MRLVHQSAFCECSSLKVVRLNEGLEALGKDEYPDNDGRWYGVFEESAIKNVELPSTLKRIEYSAFQGCENLKRIDLPKGLEYIGKQCFQESGLEYVKLPPLLRRLEESTL